MAKLNEFPKTFSQLDRWVFLAHIKLRKQCGETTNGDPRRISWDQWMVRLAAEAAENGPFVVDLPMKSGAFP